MKIMFPTMAAVFVLALMMSAGGAVADVTPIPGGYYVNTNRVAYTYEPNGAITISGYGIAVDAGPKHVVFTSVTASPFEPNGNPVERGRTVAVTGTKAAMETHDNPHATIVYRAFESGIMTFFLDSKVGAIARGDSVVVGDPGFLADMAVTGGTTITKSLDSLLVELKPAGTLVFRVQGPIGSVSELITSRRLAVELDVMVQDMTIQSDETAFEQGARIAVDSISSGRAVFSFSGLQTDSVAILDLSKDIYERFKDDGVVGVDAGRLFRFNAISEFLESSQPGYALVEGPSYVEILLRPGAASGSLVFENIVPAFDSLLAVAGLSSVIVCVAAGAFLFRRRSI